MAISKPEWFPVDPAKFFSDSLIDTMTTEEVGAALRLLGRQWLDGTIPDDQHRLARLTRLDDEAFARAWPSLDKFFPIMEPGKRANRWMWIKREAVVAELERKSDEGTRLARKRWDAARNATRITGGNAHGNAVRMPDALPTAMQDQTRADLPGGNAHGNAARMPDASTSSPAFNATDVALALCQQEGWSGTKIRLALADAITFIAAGSTSPDFKAIGEDLVRGWQRHKASGKFPDDPATFFSGAHYKTPAPAHSGPPLITDTDKFLREQRQRDADLRAENGLPR